MRIPTPETDWLPRGRFWLGASAIWLFGCTGAKSSSNDGAPRASVGFERIELSAEFLAEGANAGDFDRDGTLDIVAGPYWYAGPAFSERHTIYTPVSFDPKAYSDNFFAFVRDFDADGWDDVLVVGFPGQEARWYQNPAEPGLPWPRHPVFASVDNEAPAFTDVSGDGRPELVFSTLGRLGYAEPASDPNAPWSFRTLSEVGPFQTFTHGLGVGDLNGDSLPDLLEATAWWEQPADTRANPLWLRHPQSFGAGGAQMFTYDVDGDGDADVLTTLAAHGYGVAWFEQRSDAAGQPSFVEHIISSAEPGDSALHEPHALALADINGDGLLDVVAGERFWGHVPAGEPDFGAPARLQWFELRRGAGGVEFVPHLIDTASGVGTQVVALDVNDDARVDVVVANKKGAFVFLQNDREP